MKKPKRNPIVKDTLSAVAVAVLGFILLNIAFLINFLFNKLLDGIISLFTPADINMAWNWYPMAKHAIFLILVCLASWLVLKSKLGVLIKAIFLTLPTAVVLVTVGILLYRWPILSYLTGAALCIGALLYLHRTKLPWLYYYTIILIWLALAIFTLTGGEI